jgi:hypothetical protein
MVRSSSPIAGLLCAVLGAAMPAAAQPAAFVYRLGKDTVAVEQYTRTAAQLIGEMVQRNGAAVTRIQYQVELSKDGRATSAVVKRLRADGTVAPNTSRETRFRMTPDSVVREVVWADSVQRRAFAASNAVIVSPTFVYGLTELVALARKAGRTVDSIPAIGLTGNLGYAGFSKVGGDTVRLRGGGYAMVLRFDVSGKLLSVDGSGTTNKSTAARGAGAFDMTALAMAMKPTGVLSSRDVARGAFGQGGIVLIDYGRPSVRDRTVWGGTLVPFDSVWRAGANDATHLFTTRTLELGGSGTIPPGMYSLFIQHTASGTFLIINQQTGQWGTEYDKSRDAARIPMSLKDAPSFAEELTVTVKNTGGMSGVIEFAWGAKIASANFTARIVR